MPFDKVLVANRGEIAVRVIRALREMGIRSVAVFSDADRASLHVQMADEAAHIGAAPSSESYLNIASVMAAAARHRATAIHPGYGFLSENAEFARACEESGITFIGPASVSIRKMGSKTAAREIAMGAGVPVLPGVHTNLDSLDHAEGHAAEIGYPVLIKADAGGGGKGMRLVEEPAELSAALRDASSEAERSFRSGRVYIEKYLRRPRHVEVQILADSHGNIVHLGERECSLQRRHQKVIEESPSPLCVRIPGLRERMGEAAIQLARAAGYVNAGTVEFLATEDGSFYFLEMNTRLQVEHPVTELVTGLDLVQLQIRIAAGERLPFSQQDIRMRGSAVECRIYAEDPAQNFMPSPGEILRLEWPTGPGVRLDSGVYPGWYVPTEYDPLLAKLAVWAETRDGAIARAARATGECHIAGIATNLAFFDGILADEAFRRGDLHTGFIPEFFSRRAPAAPKADAEFVAAAAAALLRRIGAQTIQTNHQASNWLRLGRRRAFNDG